MNSYSIVFTKLFTKGLLKDLQSTPQFLSFTTVENRTDWDRG